MKRLVCFLLPLACLLSGCGSESLADRLYTQAIGLSGEETLRLSIQGFEEEGCRTVSAGSIDEALRQEEALAGGRIFVGHTELLCLDEHCTLDSVRELLFEQGLSPGCKVLCTAPERFLRDTDSTETVHTLRMAERDGLLAETELSTVLGEWLGVWDTALVPVPDGTIPGLALLHRDGGRIRLSDTAAAGMYWLRPNAGAFTLTLDEPEGETVEIRHVRVTKAAVDEEQLRYEVYIRTGDCPPELVKPLEEQVLTECTAAVREMLNAHADVIGMQDVLEAAGFRPDGQSMPDVAVSVRAE